MRFLALCVVALTIEFPGADSRAARGGPAAAVRVHDQRPAVYAAGFFLARRPRASRAGRSDCHGHDAFDARAGTPIAGFIIASEDENRWNF